MALVRIATRATIELCASAMAGGWARLAREAHGSWRCSRRCSSSTHRPASAAEALTAARCFRALPRWVWCRWRWGAPALGARGLAAAHGRSFAHNGLVCAGWSPTVFPPFSPRGCPWPARCSCWCSISLLSSLMAWPASCRRCAPRAFDSNRRTRPLTTRRERWPTQRSGAYLPCIPRSSPAVRRRGGGSSFTQGLQDRKFCTLGKARARWGCLVQSLRRPAMPPRGACVQARSPPAVCAICLGDTP